MSCSLMITLGSHGFTSSRPRENFNRFKEFKALIENQTGRHIRILRSDNEGEYESNEFDDFCREAGVKKELTAHYNPQQNGVAERKNRTC